MNLEKLAKQELEDDIKQERYLFFYEIIIIIILLFLIFFRECFWQECRLTEPDFWYSPPTSDFPTLVTKNGKNNNPVILDNRKLEVVPEPDLVQSTINNQTEDDMVFIDISPPLESIMIQEPIHEIQSTQPEINNDFKSNNRSISPIENQIKASIKMAQIDSKVETNNEVQTSKKQSQESHKLDDKAGSIQALLNAALKAREDKNLVQAEQLFQQLREREPNNIPFLLESAVVYEWQSKFSAAENFYQKVLKIEPNNINALLGKARLERWQNQLTDSQKTYAQILQLSPQNTDAITGLGMIALMDKQTSKAEDLFNQALNLNPNHHEALAGLAMLEKTFIGSLNLRYQYREANNKTFSPDQKISSLDIHHHLNGQWEMRASISQSHSEYDTLNNFGIAEINQLERRYQASLMYKPSIENYWQAAAQYDQSSQDDFQYGQIVYGQKFNKKLLVEGSVRLQFSSSELENSLYTVSLGHPIGDSNWRALAQVFYNKTELEGIDDNYALVAQTTWEPNDRQLLNFGIASSQINGKNKLSFNGSYKHFLSNNLGASISGNYSEQTELPEFSFGLHYRY